ncbi:MAG: response regulator [Victivallales bacterium]
MKKEGDFMLKALIADDDTEIRNSISAIIKSSSFQISEASTVRDVLRLCTINKFDLIFLDHHLMDGDGWAIARTIFLEPEEYGNPVIVAMTGSVSPYELDRQRGNFSMFILKPFSSSDIDAVLRQVSGNCSPTRFEINKSRSFQMSLE